MNLRLKSYRTVKGIKIKPTPIYALNCDICIHVKIFNDRNKILDRKATLFTQ